MLYKPWKWPCGLQPVVATASLLICLYLPHSLKVDDTCAFVLNLETEVTVKAQKLIAMEVSPLATQRSLLDEHSYRPRGTARVEGVISYPAPPIKPASLHPFPSLGRRFPQPALVCVFPFHIYCVTDVSWFLSLEKSEVPLTLWRVNSGCIWKLPGGNHPDVWGINCLLASKSK